LAGPKKGIMKRIKKNDLTHYFLRDHRTLPASYLRSCEKFFRELGKKRNKFQASSSNATRHNLFTEIEAASSKLQASSLTAPGSGDSNRIIKEKL
jgi:hypothetical protein